VLRTREFFRERGLNCDCAVWSNPEVLLSEPEEERPFGQEQPKSLYDLTNGTIKSVRIRYFNKNVFATEHLARDYVRGFLAHKSLPVFSNQIWSEMLDVPEFECFIEFTDDYRKKLREEHKSCRDGRLLIWQTESCFRDATGRWWFVSAFDYFHMAHPQGDRKLVN